MIRSRIPSILSLINKTIDELEAEMDHLGRPIALDSGVRQLSHCIFFSITTFFTYLIMIILYPFRLSYTLY